MSLSPSRRRLLRGLGTGALLLGPMTRFRLADAAPAGNFFVFRTGNGFLREQFGAVGTGTNFQLKPSLAAMEPYKTDLTIITGPCNKSSDPGGSLRRSRVLKRRIARAISRLRAFQHRQGSMSILRSTSVRPTTGGCLSSAS